METNAKIVICSKNMAEHLEESFTNGASKKSTNLLALEEIEKNFADLQIEDKNLQCEPIKCSDIDHDVCLIIWDLDGNGSFTK